jgi:DNA-binding NtrC family response regulator
MKILIVEDDDAQLLFLTKELEARDCEVVPTHFGDGGLSLYKKDGPFELVLSDFYFIPGSEIKNGVELVNAIHGINSVQRMALMTAHYREAREKLPAALRYLPLLRKPFKIEQVLRFLRQPVLPLCSGGKQ